MNSFAILQAAVIKSAGVSDTLDSMGRSFQQAGASMKSHDLTEAALSALIPAAGGALLGSGIGAARSDRGNRIKGALKGALLGGLLTGLPTGIYGYGKNHGMAAGVAGAGKALRTTAESV